MSHPWLFSHAPSSMSTSSSSPIYPTTQREHSAHPAHLQGPSVDKLRHQESVRSRIKAYSGDPYQLFDVQEILEKKVSELLSPKKWRNLERLGRLVCRILSRHPTFNRRYTSTIPHFDDSAGGIADSNLEDGELQKMLFSPLYAQKASRKPDAMVMQERER